MCMYAHGCCETILPWGPAASELRMMSMHAKRNHAKCVKGIGTNPPASTPELPPTTTTTTNTLHALERCDLEFKFKHV